MTPISRARKFWSDCNTAPFKPPSRRTHRLKKNGPSQAGQANDWAVLFPGHADGFAGVEESPVAEARSDAQSDAHLRLAELEQRLHQEQVAAAQAVTAAREQG